MTLSWAQVLMLPLDVSNMTGFGGGIDMQVFWFVVYITTAAFVLIIIPTLIYYYEADDEWTVVKFIFIIIYIVGENQILFLLLDCHNGCCYNNSHRTLCIHWQSIYTRTKY